MTAKIRTCRRVVLPKINRIELGRRYWRDVEDKALMNLTVLELKLAQEFPRAVDWAEALILDEDKVLEIRSPRRTATMVNQKAPTQRGEWWDQRTSLNKVQ